MQHNIHYPIDIFEKKETPFYYYNLELLNDTLCAIKSLTLPTSYNIHYAIKANVQPDVLETIKNYGMGADCVSGGEIKAALDAGFPNSKIMFAGVGKADWEINYALDNDIFCFNVESSAELEVIDELAKVKNKIANIALRINPNIDAKTHKYITTGLNENKFGINAEELNELLIQLDNFENIKLEGLHFHIGSQITDMDSFRNLCLKINSIQDLLDDKKIEIGHINVGGGLGVDYEEPEKNPIADFKSYFQTFEQNIELRKGQTLHFELGRAIVAQCGSLISKVLYVKKGANKTFLILDAGMTELIRPALYQAQHKIENLSSNLPTQKYEIVGPICESSDIFGKDYELNSAKRGDIIALKSAGAYGEIMSSNYNLRPTPKSITSKENL